MSYLLDIVSGDEYITAIERNEGSKMSMKEISAVVMVLSAIVISAWVGSDLLANGPAAEMSAAAWEMLWAIGYVIVFNIVATIVGVIVVSIAQRQEVKDEATDERDKLINGKGMAVGYFVMSVGVLGVLVWQALGLAPNWAPYALFGVSMLAGGLYAAVQFVLYRVS
jgi:hypothetical protein